MRAALLLLALLPGGHPVDSFGGAKRALWTIYADHRQTLYSHCAFRADHSVDYAHCAYTPVRPAARSRRIEWEHVVPAAAFGRGFAAWRRGHPDCVDRHGRPFRGRHCAARVDPAFRHIEADMHNLFPEIGELNQLRGDHPMAELPPECPARFAAIGVRLEGDGFEPGPQVRGDIARTYLYMAHTYAGALRLDAAARRMFGRWAAADPVDRWECERAQRIAAVQGRHNLFVELDCDSRALGPGGPARPGA